MTEIYLFSKNRKVLTFFNKLKRSRTFSLIVYNPSNYRKILSKNNDPFFAYIDISSFNSGERTRALAFITRQRKFDYGIIDPDSKIDDPAALFHKGASDYIPGSFIRGSITVNRIKKAVTFYTMEPLEEEEEKVHAFNKQETAKLSGSNWDLIKAGESYSFIFMYIEIDIVQEWISNSGKEHIDTVMNYFYKHLHTVIKPLNGRVWMKTNYGALVLFPYAGSATPVIIEAFKLILNRLIISAEVYPFKTMLSYKIALDIGSTQYQIRGNTGNIVSDSINYIFHLGTQYAERGNLYLTNRIYTDIPPGLLDYFTLSGNFEGKTLHKMKLPVFNPDC